MRRSHIVLVASLLGAGAVGCWAAEAGAQTLRGVLLDRDSGEPVPFASVLLLGQEGDTVRSTLSGPGGAFLLVAPEPGDFYLHASVLGYRDTTVGVFELGTGGELSVEFRIEPDPVAVEGVTVRVRDPQLISNGFFQRLQAGFGHFITPADIEKSAALRATDLFLGIPRVQLEYGGTGGEFITMSNAMGASCDPRIYVDGLQMSIPDARFRNLNRLDLLAPLAVIEAVEVYTSAVQIPLQWSSPELDGSRPCGAVVIWTKR